MCCSLLCGLIFLHYIHSSSRVCLLIKSISISLRCWKLKEWLYKNLIYKNDNLTSYLIPDLMFNIVALHSSSNLTKIGLPWCFSAAISWWDFHTKLKPVTNYTSKNSLSHVIALLVSFVLYIVTVTKRKSVLQWLFKNMLNRPSKTSSIGIRHHLFSRSVKATLMGSAFRVFEEAACLYFLKQAACLALAWSGSSPAFTHSVGTYVENTCNRPRWGFDHQIYSNGRILGI